MEKLFAIRELYVSCDVSSYYITLDIYAHMVKIMNNIF